MASRTISYDVRYRPAGSTDAWVKLSFAAGGTLSLTGMVRGQTYEVQIRGIDARGQTSAWETTSVTVGATNRVGSAALPNVANAQAMWDVDTSVTYAAASDAEGVSTATVSVSAGTLVIGGQTIAYGASSASVDGTAESTVVIYLYYDDPNLEGGTRPLGVTTNVVDTANVNGRVAISSLSLTFPAAGGSSTGGGSIGGGGGSSGACVMVDSWLPCGRRAGEIQVGDELQLADPTSGEAATGVVEFAATRLVPCVEIETADGLVLRCSHTAPIPVRDGYVLAPHLVGRHVPTMRYGVVLWCPVTRVTDIGPQLVRHITVGDRCFWAGAKQGAYLLHHNAKAVQEAAV